jgi:predicted MPP superfamily phosphohydrolase
MNLPEAPLFAPFYRGLTVPRYTVTTPKLRNLEPIRAVLLSDLHNHIYGEAQQPLIRQIKDLKPDVIFLAGDMADDMVPLAGLTLLLAGIAGLAPCYYVAGNHDYWSGQIDEIKRAVASYGMTVLEGQTVSAFLKGQQFNISGLDDPVIAPTREGEGRAAAYRRALEAFANLDTEKYNILVAHRPEFIEDYRRLGLDLVLSGHAHGGQVRIPFLLNGLYAPNQGFFPKYAGGLYDVGGTKLLVSRGLSYNPALPRVFNPPEVVLLEIQGIGEGQV